MTKREAKKWACGLAADLLRADMERKVLGPDSEDPDEKRRIDAMHEIIEELSKRETT